MNGEMKIAIINTVCKYGSTGRFAYSIHCEAKKRGVESLVLYGRGEKYSDEEDLIRIDSKLDIYAHVIGTRLFGLQGFCSKRATKKAIVTLESYNPDIIIIMNMHGYYLNYPMIFDWISKKRVPCIQMLYDEHAFTGRCGFSDKCEKFMDECSGNDCAKDYPKSICISRANKTWLIKKDFYKENKIMFLGSPYVVKRAKQSGLLSASDVRVLDEGVDIENIFFPHDVAELRKKLNIEDNVKVILNVAPYSNIRKGVKYYFELAKLFADDKDYVFIQVGFDGNEDERPFNVIVVPYVDNLDELSDYYCLADLFVCTSFNETVPDTCIEAMGCGVQVCGFDISGIPYSAESPYGQFVTPGDVSELERIVQSISVKTKESIVATHNYARNRYDMSIYYNKLFEYIDEFVGK